MGRILLALAILAAIECLSFASAASGLPIASSLSVKGKISPDGTDLITMIVNLPSSHGKGLTFNLSGQMDSLAAYDETGQKLDADVEIINGSTCVKLAIPNKYARIEMETNYLTSKTGARWTYNSTYAVDSQFDNFDGEVELPPGSFVRSTNGIQMDNGGTITVAWHYSGLDPDTLINRYVNYQINDTADYTALYVAGAALAGSLLLLYAVLMFRKGKGKEIRIVHMHQTKKPPETAKKQSFEDNIAFAAMEETDREILRELHGQGGKATQARIYQRTHVSKSSLSRHLISLENRGLVIRSKKGINTLVSLTDVLK